MPRAPRGNAPAALSVPSDPDAFFREFFPAQYARDPKRYGTADTPGAAVFHIDGGGSWSVRIARSRLAVERGAPADTRLTIAVSRPDFDAVFVRRTQDEVARTGTLSELSRDAFVPLFVTPRRLAIVERARGTLRFDLDHEGDRRALSITPGAPGASSEPRATIRVALDDFLQLLSRKKNPKLLFVTGRLKVKGDLGFALHMSGLVS
ncbi:MAG: SCP2 sterol-binding domain-containing protein [Deltaproteobacteria bacterium]|nr:SCP2 sterol-binding domain-containing protein [Deltaproteobacteria bacterium]